MHAYSHPITPPPTTIIDRGSFSIASSESDENTLLVLNGTVPGSAGRVPVAMMNLSAVMCSRSPGRLTSKHFGSSNFASPQIKSIPFRSKCDRTSCNS